MTIKLSGAQTFTPGGPNMKLNDEWWAKSKHLYYIVKMLEDPTFP